MSWSCEYEAVDFHGLCDRCGKPSSVYVSFEAMLAGCVREGWYVSPETFRCNAPQIFHCAACKAERPDEEPRMAPGAISFPPAIQPTEFRKKERG